MKIHQDILLRRFRLNGAWSPLLSQLPGWRQVEKNKWSDGISEIVLARSGPQFGFITRQKVPWRRIKSQHALSDNRPLIKTEQILIISPCGIPLTIEFSPNENEKIGASVVMNHVAVNTPKLQEEGEFYEKLLGRSVVLARDAAWEPVSRRFVRDIHLFRSPNFYITLRENKRTPKLDHVGWMADSRRIVDEMANRVLALKWPIVYGPAEIDGSYLFHFVGPDDRVHDFFFPTDAIPRAK